MSTPVKPSGRDERSAMSELELLIRARYPVIYVVTWEERRVEEHLQALAERRSKQLYCWSITTGLVRSGAEAPAARGKTLPDPLEALSAVIDHKEPAIYLFKDLHTLIRPRDCNTCPIRKVREVARALSDSYKTLVITAPRLDIAPDLEKDVCVIDFPLPGADEIGVLLHRIIEDLAGAGVRIELAPEQRERIVQAALGLTLQEAENVFAKTIVNDGSLSAGDISTVFTEKRQIIRKSGLLDYCEPEAGLHDVGGLESLKEWLTKRAAAFTQEARAFGLPCPRGVLLVGVQGCGKSLCAKAVAQAWNMPLLRFDVGRMFSSLVGSSEENVRRAIAVAESISPVVLWVDEIDKAFSGSQSSGSTDGGTTARVMSTFLTWLSEKTRPVFVIATANSIAQLPPELLRKGRLDEIFFVDLPGPGDRARITEIHLAKRGRDPARFDLERIAAAAEGFSGAEIEELVVSALYDAFYLGRDVVTADLLGSAAATVPLSKTMSEEIAALRAWAQGRARPATHKATSTQGHRRKLELDPVGAASNQETGR
jgi:AAA+ superfamily predicted ATPase